MALVRPHQDYANQVWAPAGVPSELKAQEAPLRAFTKRMDGCHQLHYWDRLTLARMSSTERRVDRYRALYVWKIVRGLVPNCGLLWWEDGRRGLSVRVPALSGSRMAIRTLKDKAFNTLAPKIFNALPNALREYTGSLAGFKQELDTLLASVPDTPLSDTRATFATDLQGAPSNGLHHWLRAMGSSSYTRLLHMASTGERFDAELSLGLSRAADPLTWTV